MVRKIRPRAAGVNSPGFLKTHPVRKREPKIREAPTLGYCDHCRKPQTSLRHITLDQGRNFSICDNYPACATLDGLTLKSSKCLSVI
jgi:ssDNA-binding Zn-finger/Zn-ribbon topoisomerase 1